VASSAKSSVSSYRLTPSSSNSLVRSRSRAIDGTP
jgi:hypothetical protein